MDIYDAIVSGFKKRIPAAQQNIESFLQSLQESVKALRIAYRNIPVCVPYEKTDIQAAYLVTYLPHYYQLIYKILLEEIPDIFRKKNEINITFIGGGPGSEAYGVVKYIINNCKEAKVIRVNILDINATSWGFSHTIVFENLIAPYQNDNVEITWNALDFDLTTISDVNKVKQIIEKSNLLVIQNCLNEIPPNLHSNLENNIKLIFGYLKGDGYLLISDMTSVARPIMKSLESILVAEYSPKYFKTTLSSSSSRSLISVHHKPSEVVAQNLLISTDGLIPRKNISYDYTIFSKVNTEESYNFNEVGFSAIYRPLDFKYLDANDFVHKKVFIGIDFGSSSTVVCVASLVGQTINITPLPIKQKDHLGSITKNPLVPSVISLVDRTKLLVGIHAAEHRPFLEYGKNTWHSFKQNISDLDNVVYPNSELASNSLYRISNAKDALTLFFSYVKREIFEYLSDNNFSSEVEYVISVPVGIPMKDKKSLKSCMLLAGLMCEESPFFEEPIAALLNYLYESKIPISDISSKSIIIIDLGAGTVDVSIIHLDKCGVEFTSKLLAVVRFGSIGGNLIDKLMVEKIIKEHINYLDFDESLMYELISICEKLKIKICKDIIVDKATNYQLPSRSNADEKISISASRGLNNLGVAKISMSFSEFNSLMNVYWSGTIEFGGVKGTIDNAIKNANIDSSSISAVIISGGGGRNPYIKSKIANYFINADIFISDNIQEQVARGASIQSFVLNSFGKQLIRPILGHDIYLKAHNKDCLIFENGVSIPSADVEVLIDNDFRVNDVVIECLSHENVNYFKYFIMPATIKINKLIFYLSDDLELKCELVGANYESLAEECFFKFNHKSVKIL